MAATDLCGQLIRLPGSWAAAEWKSLGRDHDRAPVLELGFARRPGAARSAATQWLDRQLQLVARL